MRFVTVRELRSKTREVQEMLAKDEVVLLSNGKPVAVMTRLGPADDVEPLLQAVRQARLRATVEAPQADAKASGLDKMTLDEINAEIAAARAERDAEAAG
jgi:antitoxin (DNA-binding transcriptional repressor) of toxin-antitoxin stability system